MQLDGWRRDPLQTLGRQQRDGATPANQLGPVCELQRGVKQPRKPAAEGQLRAPPDRDLAGGRFVAERHQRAARPVAETAGAPGPAEQPGQVRGLLVGDLGGRRQRCCVAGSTTRAQSPSANTSGAPAQRRWSSHMIRRERSSCSPARRVATGRPITPDAQTRSAQATVLPSFRTRPCAVTSRQRSVALQRPAARAHARQRPRSPGHSSGARESPCRQA